MKDHSDKPTCATIGCDRPGVYRFRGTENVICEWHRQWLDKFDQVDELEPRVSMFRRVSDWFWGRDAR